MKFTHYFTALILLSISTCLNAMHLNSKIIIGAAYWSLAPYNPKYSLQNINFYDESNNQIRSIALCKKCMGDTVNIIYLLNNLLDPRCTAKPHRAVIKKYGCKLKCLELYSINDILMNGQHTYKEKSLDIKSHPPYGFDLSNLRILEIKLVLNSQLELLIGFRLYKTSFIKSIFQEIELKKTTVLTYH